MDFRKETRGENATKAVELVACFYDNAKAEKDGEVVAQYAEIWGHPDSTIGKDQTNLALVTQRQERDGKTTFNHSISLYPKQVEEIKVAAGDNVAPLLNADGKRLGTIYGVKADLMQVQREGKTIGFMPNTKTLAASEFSVAEVGGESIRSRIFASMAATKAAKGTSEKEAPVAEKPAEVPAKKTRASKPKAAEAEAPKVEAEAELV